jgi:hypothetical protein
MLPLLSANQAISFQSSYKLVSLHIFESHPLIEHSPLFIKPAYLQVWTCLAEGEGALIPSPV